MWIIAGTIPDPDFSLLVPEGPARSASLSEAGLHCLTAAPCRGTGHRGLQPRPCRPARPLAARPCPAAGRGYRLRSGSRQLYAWLEKALPALARAA